jgi:hypothetical protein
MGTNIYLVKKIKEADTKRLSKAFSNTIAKCNNTWDLEDIRDLIQDEIDTLGKEIHICKRSAGWQILFQQNPQYECTLKSLLNFIKASLESGEWELLDEYGDPYTIEELKEDIKGFSKGYTLESYNKEKGGYNPYEHEFINDGLRWSKREFC